MSEDRGSISIGNTCKFKEIALFRTRRQGVSRDDIRSTGYVLDTLGAALWCACNTDSYEEC